MFDTFDFMAFNWCCILGGPYYPTLPYHVKFKKGPCMSHLFLSPCHMLPSPVLHVEFKKSPLHSVDIKGSRPILTPLVSSAHLYTEGDGGSRWDGAS